MGRCMVLDILRIPSRTWVIPKVFDIGEQGSKQYAANYLAYGAQTSYVGLLKNQNAITAKL